MRAVIIGAGQLAVETAELLIKRGHEVVVVEQRRERIDELSELLDCSFLHGDGSKPHILKEADPEHTDLLLCLTGSDQANILSSLVGRSLGYGKVVPRISDASYEAICLELDLRHTIIPAHTIGRLLADMTEGVNVLEMSTVLRGEARFFALVAGATEVGLVDDLKLPDDARVVCVYRGDEFLLARGDTAIQEGDQIVVLTHAKNLPALHKRWTAIAG